MSSELPANLICSSSKYNQDPTLSTSLPPPRSQPALAAPLRRCDNLPVDLQLLPRPVRSFLTQHPDGSFHHPSQVTTVVLCLSAVLYCHSRQSQVFMVASQALRVMVPLPLLSSMCAPVQLPGCPRVRRLLPLILAQAADSTLPRTFFLPPSS